MEAEAATTACAPVPSMRPRFRGVSHKWGFFVSLIAGGLLVASATNRLGVVAVTVYVASLSALLGTSALYHRTEWTCALKRRWVGRLDHAMIFVLIAGTYTPFALLGLFGPYSKVLLVTIWTIAAVGSVLTLFWYDKPKWVIAVLYVAVGWFAVFGMSPLLEEIGLSGLVFVVLGGVLYSVGALVYGLKRPDPLPRIFGYHEIFHAFVLAGATAHFFVVAFLVPI